MIRTISLISGIWLLAAPGLAQDAPVLPAPEATLSLAQQREDSLDRLFASLRRPLDEKAARSVEKKIWDIWSRSDSPTADLLLGQAVRAMNAAETDASSQILEKVITTYPAYTEAWNKRATLKYQLKDYDAALQDIDRVLDMEPRHFGALAGRGMIFSAQKKYVAALAAFREALAINPNMPGLQTAVDELERIFEDA